MSAAERARWAQGYKTRVYGPGGAGFVPEIRGHDTAQVIVLRLDWQMNDATLRISLNAGDLSIDLLPAQLRDLAQRLTDAADDIEQGTK